MRRASLTLMALAAVATACVAPQDPVASVSVSPSSVRLLYSEVQTIDFEFSVLAPIDEGANPRVFVHLYEEPVDVLRTFDHPFPGEWQPGATVRHRLRIYQSALGPPLRAGRYFLSVGLYDIDGRRWPLEIDGEEIDRMEYAVAEIVVTEDSALPMFRFSDAWEPIEAGQGRQILGRRWLAGEGSLWVTETASADSIWMQLQLPAAVEGVSRMMLDPGAEEPRVMVVSECGGVEVELVGPGPHEVEIPLGGAAAAGADGCEISLHPNFHLLENGHGRQRSVLLEALAWSATAD